MDAAERERIDQMVQRRIDASNAHRDERQHKLDTWDDLLAACELALECGEECVCEGSEGGCLGCILTAAVKAAKP